MLRVVGSGASEHLANARYEDLLRAIGAYIDQNGWHDVLLTQLPEGVLLKGTAIEASQQGGRVERVVSVLFTHEDVAQMLDLGLARRQLSPADLEQQGKPKDHRPFWRRP